MSRLDIRQRFKSFWNKSRLFFSYIKWKEIGVFIFFLAISLGFWYLQALQQDYEIEVKIPIKYNGVPPNMFLVGKNPEELSVKVKDKGMILLNYLWFRSFSPLELNVGKNTDEVQDGNVYKIEFTRRQIQAAISKQLLTTTQLLSFDPQSIQVTKSALEEKVLPVQLNVMLQLELGYQLSDTIQITPAFIKVYGSSIVLDTLAILRTEYKEFRKLKDTKEIKLKILPVDGVRIDTKEVAVKFPIEEFVEKRLEIFVQCPDLPSNYVLRIFPPHIDVLSNVPISKFKLLEADDFEIEVPFSTFQENQELGRISLELTKQPDWVSFPTIEPSTIEFILEQKSEE